MQGVIRRISTAVYALGVLGALTFGASQAFGRAAYVTCRDDGGTFLGACVTGPDSASVCTENCQLANHDPEAVGHCPGGCCVCFL